MLVGTLLAATAAWATHHFRQETGPEHAETEARTPATERSDGLRHYDLDLARSLFAEGLEEGSYLFDPLALLVRKPDLRTRWSWEEHPRGGFRVWTNELGFNETGPTRRIAPDVRILVAGDSHTQGVVDPDESYANVLEHLLRAADRQRSVDVLNAGVAYTGPSGYLGMLQRTLELGLRPDVFIAGLFTGNDLQDELALQIALGGEVPPAEPAGYWEPLQAAAETDGSLVAQGFNQLYRYKHFPLEASRALELVIASYERMQALCAAQGILLVALVIPTKMDVDLDDDRERITRCKTQLGLSTEEMGGSLRASQRFVAAMKERGILCVDPTEAMTRLDTPLYWRRDYHLNVDGHRMVAELLNEALRGRL